MLFVPEAAVMYPAGYSSYVDVEGITSVLEGASRPDHFRGVATVVAKLFNIVKPHVAYFGQKDAQQVVVVKRMVADLNMDVRLVIVPTVRESDGLARSSRNAFLGPVERAEAPVLYRALQQAERRVREGDLDVSAIKSEMRNTITGASSGIVDYVSVADARTLAELGTLRQETPLLISLAVRFGTTRLIDNVLID
jgi:pantoate--beta-alanine ligase